MGMVQEWHAVDPDEAAAVVATDGDAVGEWLEQHPPAHPVLDLDKQWHAVHAVLTDTAWDTDGPCGRAVLGGTEFGEDIGYGPARLLSAEEVAAVAVELEAHGTERFAAAISRSRLAELEVYPSSVDWDHPDERTYLTESFEQLRSFYRDAADAGRAVILVLV